MTDQTTRFAFGTATGQDADEEAKRRAKRAAKEQAFFAEKVDQYRGEIRSRQDLERVDYGRIHQHQKIALEAKLRKFYGPSKTRDAEELAGIKARRAQGLSEADRIRIVELRKNLADARMREKNERDKLAVKQKAELAKIEERNKKQSDQAERNIHAAWQKRQLEGWKPAPVVFGQAAQKEPGRTQTPAKTRQAQARQSAPVPTLAPKGARTGNLKPVTKETTQSSERSQSSRESERASAAMRRSARSQGRSEGRSSGRGSGRGAGMEL